MKIKKSSKRKREKSREHGGEKKRKVGVWETHFITILCCCNYAIYTATIEGRPLRSTFSLTTGLENEEGVGGAGVEVLSLSWLEYEAEAHMD